MRLLNPVKILKGKNPHTCWKVAQFQQEDVARVVTLPPHHSPVPCLHCLLILLLSLLWGKDDGEDANMGNIIVPLTLISSF